MADVRSMLKRVAALERARAAPRCPFDMDAFEADVQRDMDEGKLDRIDMPLVLDALRRWIADDVWGSWSRSRDRVWEHGR